MKALYDLPAPAKLNLFLHVVGRRADGYHLLQSVFVPIDWMDLLHLERRSDGRLQRHDLGTPLPADDLCLRAARLLQESTGCGFGVDIHIDKRIPSGAGHGRRIVRCRDRADWPEPALELGLTRANLSALALRLGADVPFFLGSGPAWVEGIGEQLTSIAVPGAGPGRREAPGFAAHQADF